MKRNNLFSIFSVSSSCIRHANYIYLLFWMNTCKTMKWSCLWQVLGAFLTCFTKIPVSAFQLSQKTKDGIKPRFTNFARCSVTQNLDAHLSSQPEQGWHQAPGTACSGGKPWKRWVAAGRGSSSSFCRASSTETRGMQSEMFFCGTVRRDCLTTELVKSSTTSQQDETQRDWSWFHSLKRSWSCGREGWRSWYSQNISDPRVKKENTTIKRELIQTNQQFLP